LIKEIGQIKRNKGNADEDKEVAVVSAKVTELVKKRDAKAFLLGNIVDKNSAVSTTEVDLPPLLPKGVTLMNRMTTQFSEFGTRSPTTRATPSLDFRLRTRQRESSRITRSSLDWKHSTWSEVSCPFQF
jgi:hypothetical protein